MVDNYYYESMDARHQIMNYIAERKTATGPELAKLLNITPQAVHKHLKVLVTQGRIMKSGGTRKAAYSIVNVKCKSPSSLTLKKDYFLAGLQEHEVFQRLAAQANLRYVLSGQALTIVRYAFTELLNNAIDHSRSERCLIVMSIEPYVVHFSVRDFGIGLFHSIAHKFNLADEVAAMQELIKGKITTMAERHSGEGIFFTSKVADRISFRSHNIGIVFDNRKNDILVEDRRSLKGTEVDFIISRRSKRDLNAVFSAYAPAEYDFRFEKTKVAVKLFQEEYISRSEAKRLLVGLDKFKEIVLDFKGVKTLGQGFADEVFRVYGREHPDTLIRTENLSPVLEQMIRHTVDNGI